MPRRPVSHIHGWYRSIHHDEDHGKMTRTIRGALGAFLGGVGVLVAAPLAAQTVVAPPVDQSKLNPAAIAAADGGIPPFTPADVAFMSGMIHHHAQAILMAKWAASHGASPTVRTLAGRIDVSQTDEIEFMQRWLAERKQPVPDGRSDEHAHHMGHASGPMMPGMLTPEQLKALDAAQGKAFDELFLKFMIQHHQGALSMLEALFSAPGAGNDGQVFKFASDVEADQSTEIQRMTSMLEAMGVALR
ncbi:MAG: DUF305 domain-containing protein [Gemmatimonadales bacterium]|nr:DUF305 domain-containing protein [Gemmatimonadales bacterium]